MAVTYRFDFHIIIIEMAGEYLMDDIRKTLLIALNEPKCPASPVLMINLTESQSIYHRTPEDVKAMAHIIVSQGKSFNHRLALVAPNNLAYGMMRMSSVEAEDWGIKAGVFRTFSEAREWLLS
jgi:hypothetical protein